MPLFARFCTAALVVLTAVPALAQPVDVYPARTESLSLNGTWQFRYQAGIDAQFGQDTAGFAPITVPGHWELQGFAEPKYGSQLLAGIGLYRRTFRVPAAWSGQRVLLRFDGVLYGYEAWINGTSVGSWASGYNSATFDITAQLKPGADNTLAVRVTTRSHGWEFDTNDDWSISGIYRDVTLFAVPAAHLEKYTARTHLNADGSATLAVAAFLSAPAAVTGRLLAPDGSSVAELKFGSDHPATGATSNSATATLNIEHPQLWTAETPSLYTLDLALSSGEHITEKIGLREVTIRDGLLLLNGRPIKLRGVDHHDLWPEHGRVATEALMRRDLGLMRAANINFIRTSHYPPDPRFLALCDELGFYVMDEVPFGFGDEHLTDPAYQPDLLTRARATVTRDANHPCVIVWSVGNENPITSIQLETGREVKRLDPTRPICFPTVGSYFARNYRKFPDFVDIYSPHYPSTATARAYATKFDRPVIFTEYAHQLGLAAGQVQAQWAIIQASPRIAGGAIWMFQDQGLLRTAAPGVTPGNSHNLGLAVWPDATHYYDSEGNQGMDGIVYSDRTPQVDYWQVRKVYSPVQISARIPPGQPGTNRAVLHVENRFDFRDLAGITLTWSLTRNGTVVQQGAAALRAAPHGTEDVPVGFNLPADAGTEVYALALRCAEGSAPSFYERSLRLAPPAPARSRVQQLVATEPAAPLQLDETPEEIRITHPGFSLTVLRANGEVTLRDPAGRALARGFFPHTGRRFTEGERMRAKKEQTWAGDYLVPAAAPAVAAVRNAEGITVTVRGSYPRPDAPGQSLEGELQLLVRTDGTIDVDYDYQPVNGHGLLLEAGLSLVVPAAQSEFRWIGAGPYAGYPGKDALNEFGLFHLNRADLHFQGNRRQVELALLTDPAGAGVAMGGSDMDVAVERVGQDTILSHNAVLSGRGTKFVGPDTAINAASSPKIAGHFTLLALGPALGPDWPAPLTRWFGPASASVPVFHPYFHSYDQ